MSSATPTTLTAGKTTFIALFVLYLLLILYPILRADRYYSDDLVRALDGFYGWDLNGRHLSMLVMRLLQFNLRHLVDISPLPQLGAIAVLAGIGVLIARRYAIDSPWLATLIAFPLGAQPFFLENLSYKFDALSMTLALFCALLPFLAFKNDRKGYLLGGVALFASLNLYQPALSAFLIFSLLEWLMGQLAARPPRELVRVMAWRAGQCLAVMLLYQTLIAPSIDDWLKQHTTTIHSLQELGVLKTNAILFYGYIGKAFNIHWMRAAAPLLIGMGLIPLLVGVRYARQLRDQPWWQRLLWLPVGLLLPLLAVGSIAGPMLPLLNPVVLPRVLMGVGALLCAGLIAACAAFRAWRLSDRWTFAHAALWALGMLSFAAAYGNALAAQKIHEERVASALANDVAILASQQPVRFILVNGSVGLAPVTVRAAQQFPLINTLIFPYLREADFHTSFFLRYYLHDTPELARVPGSEQQVAAVLAQVCMAPVRQVSNDYALRLVGDTVVATFPAGLPSHCS
jgi:hypothetical protein